MVYWVEHHLQICRIRWGNTIRSTAAEHLHFCRWLDRRVEDMLSPAFLAQQYDSRDCRQHNGWRAVFCRGQCDHSSHTLHHQDHEFHDGNYRSYQYRNRSGKRLVFVKGGIYEFCFFVGVFYVILWNFYSRA